MEVMVGQTATSQQREFFRLLGWILVSAVVGGTIGWGVSQSLAPAATTLALVFGAAAGGGFGAVVRLFVFVEDEPHSPESVTLDAGTSTDHPDPEPLDLFEGSPDPICYFDDVGEGPVVRAVNPAFEETFGVGAETVENAALGDALMLADRTEDVVAAAAAGDAFDAVLACETGERTLSYRVRTVAAADAVGTRGYVLYTPVERTG